jgi:hypothetical protein
VAKKPNQLYVNARKRQVDTALAMDKEFHDWQAEFMPDSALAFVRRAEVYNRITRKGIVGLVKLINDKAPTLQLGSDNCNTGRANHRYKIGNEGSRVIYVHLDAWATDPGFVWKKFVKEIEQYAKKQATCDEFHVKEMHGGRFITIRIWWD